jgi:hypothetical protein
VKAPGVEVLEQTDGLGGHHAQGLAQPEEVADRGGEAHQELVRRA